MDYVHRMFIWVNEAEVLDGGNGDGWWEYKEQDFDPRDSFSSWAQSVVHATKA